MDQNTGQALVLNGESGSFAVLHLEVVGRTIQLKAICTLDLNSVVVAILQRQEGAAIFIGGHGIH